MNKSIDSFKFLFSYVKKYWISLIFIVILIVSATYFQVIAPQLLGDSVDNMSKYVINKIIDNKQKEIEKKINSGQELSLIEKQEIAKGMNLDDAQKKQFEQLTTGDIKALFDVNNIKEDAINLDTNRIKNEEGFSQIQKDFIINSNLDNKYKLLLINETPIELKKFAENNVDFNKASEDDRNIFIKGLLKLSISYGLIFLASMFYSILMILVSSRTTRRIRKGLFGKFETLSIRFFDQTKTGELLSRFINDIDNITMFLNETLVQILSQISLFIGVILMMYRDDVTTIDILGITINKPLVISMISFGVIAICLATIIMKKANKYILNQQERLGVLNGFIDETLSAQKEIITYSRKDEVIEEFNRYNNRLVDVSLKGQIFSGILLPLMMGVGYVNLGFLVFFGSFFVQKGMITIGVLIAFIQYSQMFFQPLSQIVSQYNTVEKGFVGAQRIKEIMQQKEEIIESPNAIEINKIDGNVIFKNVNFSYNKGDLILKNINLDIKKGKMIAIVGPTGSGKSTIMNLLNRFYDIDSGEILVDGINIKNITLKSLHKNVGIVLQDSILFTGTIRDNISYGNPKATIEDVIEAAKVSNIHDYIMTLEEGYDTRVSDTTSIFSVGQKQLLSIARTILTNPSLLILDEATSNVDTVTEAKLQKAMDNVIKDRTSFVIAHRLKTILNADEIMVLKDGEILEKGSHEELIKQGDFYAELYKNQFVE